jgi:hypothetical protein
LFPSIVLFCAIGVYSTNNNTFDIWMVAIFGVIGYLFIKLGTEPAPLLLGFILGPMMEEYLRRALSGPARRVAQTLPRARARPRGGPAAERLGRQCEAMVLLLRN